jgi:acyl-CoA reductase-like NAD-dependent aldehyde dehydrogenase
VSGFGICGALLNPDNFARPVSQTPGELRGFLERATYLLSIAEDALKDVSLQSSDKPGFRRYIRRVPFGVAFIIVPWKYVTLTMIIFSLLTI